MTPAADQTGTATITVTVSDGTAAVTDTFVLTVTAVNDVPTISDISDQNTLDNTAVGPLAFTVGDSETPAGSLTVTASSSDQSVVPDANLALGGTGASRSLTVTPVLTQTGTVTITVTVSDGTATATDTFTVVVTASNAIPTLTNVLDQTTPQNTAMTPVVVTVADSDHSTAELTLTATSADQTLVPDANIVILGLGSVRTVTVTPVHDQTGTVTITLVVSDGIASAVDTFDLTVVPNQAPTISSLADQTTAEDTATTPVAFTRADPDTPVVELVVTASSSDPSLVAHADIVLLGVGGSRTLTATPVPDQTGTVTITVTVSDGTQTATEAFALTIAPGDDSQTIASIADQTTDEDWRRRLWRLRSPMPRRRWPS